MHDLKVDHRAIAGFVEALFRYCNVGSHVALPNNDEAIRHVLVFRRLAGAVGDQRAELDKEARC